MGLLGKVRSALAGVAVGIRASMGGGRAYSETVGWSPDRSNVMYWAPADSRQHLPAWTRVQINGKVEWLFQNFGVVKEGVRGIVRHTVGRGRSLQLNSEDTDWNEEGEMDWETYALSKSRCDVANRRNFYDFQNLAGWQRLKQGEFIAAWAANPRWDGEVSLQAFDASEIKTPEGMGPEQRVFDGVQLDENCAAVTYYAASAGGKLVPIPATSMIHWYALDGVNAVRGVSEFAQAVNPLIDIHDLIKVTTKTGKLHGAMALLVKRAAKVGGQGAVGAIRNETARRVATPAPPPPGANGLNPPAQGAEHVAGPALERVFSGGAIMYVDDENDVRLVSASSPSPLVEPFVSDMLMRDVCSGWGVPEGFFWGAAKVGAGAQRAIFVKAELFFTVFGDGIDTELGTPWVVRYLEARMAAGKLRRPKDENWMQKIAWQGPQKLSVDDGRVGALELQQLANGVENMQSSHDRRGRNWRTFTQQWFREWGYAYKCAVKAGVPWAMKFWRASTPGAAGGPSAGTGGEPGSDKPEPGSGDQEPGGGQNDNDGKDE